MSTTTATPYTTAQAVAALRRLEARWPDHLYLWSGATFDRSILVMDNTKRQDGDDSAAQRDSAVVATIGIPGEAGDPDWIHDMDGE